MEYQIIIVEVEKNRKPEVLIVDRPWVVRGLQEMIEQGGFNVTVGEHIDENSFPFSTFHAAVIGGLDGAWEEIEGHIKIYL